MILNPEEYEEVKNIQLDILLEFDRICKANDIHYNLYFGTMLGAVRHQGFIPWDDDIDVAMTRENYNKFLSIDKNKIRKEYFIQSYETDHDFFRPFTRLRKNNTIYKQRHYKNLDIHHGVFIDIFPLDNVYKSKKKEYFRYQYLYFLRRLNIIKHFGIKKNSNKIKKIAQKIIDKVLPNYEFNQYITNVMTKRNSKNTSYLNHLTNEVNIDRFDVYLIKKADFLDSILIEFEGHEFPIPRNYNKYLTKLYGDYMKLPPKEEQVPHHQVIEIKL